MAAMQSKTSKIRKKNETKHHKKIKCRFPYSKTYRETPAKDDFANHMMRVLDEPNPSRDSKVNTFNTGD
jgi:hypothetical protein